MKIAIYGSTGTIGQRIVAEALRRGHGHCARTVACHGAEFQIAGCGR